MDYTLGKWLESIDAKLNAVLLHNGVDPNTLEPLDQTPGEPQEPEEEIDIKEPEARTPEELQGKADAIKKAMNKQKSGTRWQG